MYGCLIAVGIIVCFLNLLWQLRDTDKKLLVSLTTVLLALALGLIMAKLFYVLLLFDATIALDGVEALFYPDADTFSIFGACVGACLGAWISAHIFGVKPSRMLDRFVPCLALLLALLRAAEKELGTIGVGGFVDSNSAMACFPFAVTNAYGEHLYAVFYLEAIFALLCGILFLALGKGWRDGVKTELCLFFLALPQVPCESLRMRCMKWGFVRIEQLLCALLLLALIWYACKKKRKAHSCRYLALLIGVLCVAGIGGIEFAIDKSGIPIWACYALMVALLTIMAIMECLSVQRRANEASAPLL